MSGDAHHIAQPPMNGRGAILAMQRALTNGGIKTRDVLYLNAHATSTPQGDAAEATALRDVFDAECESQQLPIYPDKISWLHDAKLSHTLCSCHNLFHESMMIASN